MYVPSLLGNLHNLFESLSRGPNGGGRYLVGRLVAFGRKALAAIPFATLLIIDQDASDFSARAFRDVVQLPVLYLSGDIDPFDLGIRRAASVTGLLLGVVRDVHLVSTALVLGLCGPVTTLFYGTCHGSLPPLFIEVRLGMDLLGPAVDLPGGLAKLLLTGPPQYLGFAAELLFPGRGMSKGDQVARPFIQFSQRGP